MPTTKRTPAIAAHFIMGFEGNLKRLHDDEIEEVCMTLDDISSEDPIRYSNLPSSIPQVVRKQIVAKSQQVVKLHREIEDMLALLARVAERTQEQQRKANRKKRINLRVGSMITLKANTREGWREQSAKVLGLEGNGSIMVYVKPEHDLDDGIREITVEQIKAKR